MANISDTTLVSIGEVAQATIAGSKLILIFGILLWRIYFYFSSDVIFIEVFTYNELDRCFYHAKFISNIFAQYLCNK